VETNTRHVTEWIVARLKEHLPKSTLRESLHDGVLFCKLVASLGYRIRFHKKPKQHAMQIENIGFFLLACKTCFRFPDSALFDPTDVHDTSQSSFRKILSLLVALQCEADPNFTPSTMRDEEQATVTRDEEQETVTRDEEQATVTRDEEQETVTRDEEQATVSQDDHEHIAVSAEEPNEDECHSLESDEPENENKIGMDIDEDEIKPPALTAEETTEGNWLLQNPATEERIQSEVLDVIESVIGQELSIRSQNQLIARLQMNLTELYKRLMVRTDDEVHGMALQMGLHHAQSCGAVPRSQEIDIITKFGRCSSVV